MRTARTSKPTSPILHEKKQELDRVRQFVLTALRDHPCQIYLFGSWAAGTAYPSSDVDIGVLPGAPLPAGFLSQLRFDLDESSILLKVALIDLSETDASFRERVLKEGILWTDSSKRLAGC